MKSLIIFLLTIFLVSCAKEQGKKSVIKEKSLDLQVKEAYLEGLDASR